MDLPIEFARGVTLRRSLEQALRAAIRSGRLPPGATLPASRVLAEQLGVSRGVVVDSYAQLKAEGYLAARRGSNTRVADLPSEWGVAMRTRLSPPPRARYDLRPGQADFHGFPRTRWQAALVRTIQHLPDARLTYGDPRGAAELRNAVADYLARARAAVVEPEHVVICCGISHGLVSIGHALRRRGARRVAIEDPAWRWHRYGVEHAGLEAVPVRVDEHGLVVAELERADVDAVVVTPAHHYPTGVVLAPERRRALIAWARRHRALVIEDDYDAEYAFDREPVASLQGLAPDVVAFCATTSKTLAPALRLAWLVLPHSLVAGVEDELRLTGVTPPTLEQVAMASFIEDASLDRHLRKMRRVYHTKRDALVAALEQYLPEVRAGGIAAGFQLTAWLPEGVDERELARKARELGVHVHELHRHCTWRAPSPPAIILGYGHASVPEIRAGVKLLATAFRPA